MSHNVMSDRSEKPKVDLNDIEMVFGTPNSSNIGVKPEILIANERNHGRDTHIANKHRGESDTETHSGQPLLEPDKEPPKPPLAGPEIDDLDETDDHSASPPHIPYPGIDDGLLEPTDNHIGGSGSTEKEGHEGSPHSHDSHPPTHDDGIGTDDDGKWWHSTDQADHPYGFGSVNGLEPRFGVDERPLSPGPGSTTPDVNTYQQKKNLAQGMMDLALLSANANQLRFVLEFSSTHPYYYASVTFISVSIILQIAVGVGLIMNSRYDVTDKAEICKADKINNMTVLGVFLITIVNVFITSFSGFSNTPSTPAVAGAGVTVQQAG